MRRAELINTIPRVFPIPDAIPSELAAPMMCAGITMYSPLVRNGAGPGKKVAIVGLGGLGHFGLLFAKALGAETWVISRTHSKEEDAMKMGADGFLATADKDWNEPHKCKFCVKEIAMLLLLHDTLQYKLTQVGGAKQ